MAIQWGSWADAGGNGMRVGLDVSIPLDVTHSSTVAVFQVLVYTQNRYTYSSDAQSLDYTDDLAAAGSFPFTNGEGSQIVQRDTEGYTYTYSTYGSSPGNRTFTATISGAVNGVTPTVSVTMAIPARPVNGPDAPTGATLVRNSDTSATLTWTPHPTGPNPYTSQTISMRRWDGSVTWTEASWSIVASVSAGATSYTRTGLSANHPYQLSVRAENNFGSSDWDDSNVIFMTPAAPSDVASVTNTTGSAITTTWTDNSYTYPSTGTWTIQRSVAGGAYANVGTVSAKTPTSFTDNSPGAGTNQYRVAAVVGALQSAYATGNLVAAPTPPLAPTLLVPDGIFVDFVNDVVVFSWQYNAGGTGAAQTHFTIEKSIDSGANWTALGTATNVASGTASFSLPAGTLSNGVPYLWRVRTEGIVSAGFGANSASASVQGSTKPTVTLSLPTATTNTIPIRAQWTFAQAELRPQIAYQALLYDSTGTILLEEINGFDATSTVGFTYATVTGNSYVVKVRAQSSAGIWSNYSTVTTSFILLPPALPTATGVYQACTGTVLLHFSPGTVIPGTNVALESITVERRVAGGDWVILATGLLIPTDFLDTLPLTNGLNEYRITARSATPSTAVAPILSVQGTDGAAAGDPLWAWISYGDNFEFDLRVHGDLTISETTGRVKAEQHFLGRAKPVALVGQNTNRSVSVSGSLEYDRRCPPIPADACLYASPPTAWRDAGENSEVVCYRDFTGRRIFGTLSDVTVNDGIWPGKAAVAYAVTEVDFTERYVQLVSA
jgi:hypothetical protein